MVTDFAAVFLLNDAVLTIRMIGVSSEELTTGSDVTAGPTPFFTGKDSDGACSVGVCMIVLVINAFPDLIGVDCETLYSDVTVTFPFLGLYRILICVLSLTLFKVTRLRVTTLLAVLGFGLLLCE